MTAQPPNEDAVPPTPPRPRPGADLRRAREQAGISLAHMAERTLITQSRLQALEKDDYNDVGGLAFVAGYARAYAKVLGVAAEPYVRAFEDAVAQDDGEAESAAFRSSRDGAGSSKVPLLLLGAAVVAVVVLLWVVMFGDWDSSPTPAPAIEGQSASIEQPRDPVDLDPVDPVGRLPAEVEDTSPEPSLDPEPAPAPDPVVQVPEQPSPPPADDADEGVAPEPAPASPPQSEETTAVSNFEAPEVIGSVAAPEEDQLILSFTDECWVEVNDATGERIIAQVAQSGDNLRLSGQAPFDLMLGNARAVDVALNGEPVPVNPASGRRTLRLTVGG